MAVLEVIRSVILGEVAGGATIAPTMLMVGAATTGQVVQLRTGLKGALTWSKLSGASAIAIAGSGAVTLTAALGAGAAATARARVENTDGDAIERLITLNAAAAPTPTPTPTPTPSPAPGIAAPVIHQESSAGSSPFLFYADDDASFQAGLYWHVQRSAASTFAVLNGEAKQQITLDDLATTAAIVFTDLVAPPAGPLWLRLRVGREDGSGGYVWGDWSNVLNDTLTVLFTPDPTPKVVVSGYGGSNTFNWDFAAGDTLISADQSTTAMKIGGVDATLVHGPNFTSLWRVNVAAAGTKEVFATYGGGFPAITFTKGILTGVSGTIFAVAQKAGGSEGSPHLSPSMTFPPGKAAVMVGSIYSSVGDGITLGNGTLQGGMFFSSGEASGVLYRLTPGEISYSDGGSSSYTAGAFAVLQAA